MRNSMTALLAAALSLAAATAALASDPAPLAEAEPSTPGVETPDLEALIECRGDLAAFQALSPVLQDPLRAVAMGWRPLPQANLFMTEFVLPAPISVLGRSSDHIAFAGDTLLAVLDLPDPRPLALELELEAAIDTPTKVMFGKEVRSIERVDPATGQALVESQVLAVSNVDSHPGKALVGCSYSLDLPAEPDPAPEGTTTAHPAPGADAPAP